MKLSQAEKVSIEDKIQKKFQSLIEASKALDFDRYLEFIHEDLFTGLNSNGRVFHCRDEMEELFRPGFAMMEKIEALEFSKVRITVINDKTAILVNEFSDRSLLKNGETFSSKGGGCQVWAFTDEDWKLVSISSSSKG